MMSVPPVVPYIPLNTDVDARERSNKTGFFISIDGIIIKNVYEIPLTQADNPGALQLGPSKAGMIHICDLDAHLHTSHGSRTP